MFQSIIGHEVNCLFFKKVIVNSLQPIRCTRKHNNCHNSQRCMIDIPVLDPKKGSSSWGGTGEGGGGGGGGGGEGGENLFLPVKLI